MHKKSEHTLYDSDCERCAQSMVRKRAPLEARCCVQSCDIGGATGGGSSSAYWHIRTDRTCGMWYGLGCLFAVQEMQGVADGQIEGDVKGGEGSVSDG